MDSTTKEIARLMASNDPRKPKAVAPAEGKKIAQEDGFGFNLLLLRIWREIWLAHLSGCNKRMAEAMDRHAEFYGWKASAQRRAKEIIELASPAEIVAALGRTEKALGRITFQDVKGQAA